MTINLIFILNVKPLYRSHVKKNIQLFIYIFVRPNLFSSLNYDWRIFLLFFKKNRIKVYVRFIRFHLLLRLTICYFCIFSISFRIFCSGYQYTNESGVLKKLRVGVKVYIVHIFQAIQ